MAGAADAKGGKMTVFKTDRHEDYAAMAMVGLVTVAILFYMAFLVGEIKLKAPDDGKVLEILVAADATVKKGDKLAVLAAKDKKMVGGKLEEKPVNRTVTSSLDGKVQTIKAKVGDSVKKGKDVLMVLIPEKGQLP
jgi:multidrug efflux pump subunit AcrA (membrane-fusion protein)